MKLLYGALITLIHEDSGQDLVEYALVAALIGLGAVTTMQGLANTITNVFAAVSSTLASSV